MTEQKIYEQAKQMQPTDIEQLLKIFWRAPKGTPYKEEYVSALTKAGLENFHAH